MGSCQSWACGAVVGDVIVDGDGGVQCGSANPGPHQSSVEWYSFQSSQILRERSVSRFSRGKPMAAANLSAPSPTSMTWPVCSITALETAETFLMLRTPPTDPARRLGPCMQQASSSTTPSSLGRPPSPTESSFGSSSGPFTTRKAASSVSPPLFRKAKASSRYLTPLLAQIIIGRFTLPDGSAARGASFLLLSCAFRPVASDAAIAEPRNPRRLMDMNSPNSKRREGYHGSPMESRASPPGGTFRLRSGQAREMPVTPQ